MRRINRPISVWLTLGLLALAGGEALSQPAPDTDTTSGSPAKTPAESAAAAVPDQVDVEPLAQDDEISGRLASIMKATGWFDAIEVHVEDGVVFLEGTTGDPEHKEWITQLARRTQDVVAVVNQIHVHEGPFWDLSPAWSELRLLALSGVQALPLLIVAGTLLVLGWFGALVAVRLSRRTFERRMGNRLLREVASKAVAIPVFLIFMYIALRVSGLTQLAATVLGGTGLLGLVIGIAFRDIAENYLASILISMQRPFSMGDRIEVAGFDGFVQSVTTRGTVMMTLDGNHVQIPNSMVYKSTIRNYTANPRFRRDFAVGISYADSIAHAQEIAMRVLRGHEGVVSDPEPLVLVESLGSSAVQLRVLFWVDITTYSDGKVLSAVMRHVKQAFQEARISMPDEAREVIFPEGIPVRMLPEQAADTAPQPDGRPRRMQASRRDNERASSQAEGNLTSDAAAIQKQAAESRLPDESENLIAATPATDGGDEDHAK